VSEVSVNLGGYATLDLTTYAPAYPKFVIVSVSPAEVDVKVGSTFTVTVVVRNDGDVSGTCKVSLIDHEGNVQDSISKTIDPGMQETFTLTGVAPSYITAVPYRIKVEVA